MRTLKHKHKYKIENVLLSFTLGVLIIKMLADELQLKGMNVIRHL